MSKLQRPRSFRIYPDPQGGSRRRKLYFEARVYRNRAEMLAADCVFQRDNGIERSNTWLRARMWWFGPKCDPRRPNLVGLVFLHKQVFGAGIVTHERAHGALKWWRYELRRKLSDRNHEHHEERFVRILHSMVAQFWEGWFGRKKISQ